MTYHKFVCHSCVGGHANFLSVVPVLLYALPEMSTPHGILIGIAFTLKISLK